MRMDSFFEICPGLCNRKASKLYTHNRIIRTHVLVYGSCTGAHFCCFFVGLVG